VLVSHLLEHGDSAVVARGGRGGMGSSAWSSARHGGAARELPQVGGRPEESCVLLDRRLAADVALVGLPNAGKSSLLRAMTSARPRVAPYAFTTLQPQLGALRGSVPSRWTCIADLPGLLAGASRDRGLGLDFLKCATFASQVRSCSDAVCAMSFGHVQACGP
jgi:GTPase